MKEGMKNRFYDLPDIAKERPLVVLFGWERYGLLKMVLPRLVNAVRHIGGYLVAIDDASLDERIAPFLRKYEEQGYVDMAFVGTKNRHIDWTTGNPGYGKQTARRSVMLHLLAHRGAPLVICCDADIVMQPDALEVLLEGSRVAREAGIQASHFCGFRYNKTVWDSLRAERRNIDNFRFVLFAQNTSMALSLVPLDIARKVDREGPAWHHGKWSLNEYAERAWLTGKYHSCYLFDVMCQHVGVGFVGRTFTDVMMKEPEVAAFEEDGSLLEIKGFDVKRFYDIAFNGSYISYERFFGFDNQEIYPTRPIHPEFVRLKGLING